MSEAPERRYKLNKCDLGWFTLKKIVGETEVRYCDTCDKCVHWCDTEVKVIEAAKHKWCIATENRLIFSKHQPKSTDFESTPKNEWSDSAEKTSYFIGEFDEFYSSYSIQDFLLIKFQNNLIGRKAPRVIIPISTEIEKIIKYSRAENLARPYSSERQEELT